MARDAGHIEIAKTVMRHLQPGARILDFGAGPCDKTAVVAALGYSCTAADDLGDEWHQVGDKREAILAFAESFGIRYLALDGNTLPVKSDTYDMVMLHDVIEHLHNSPRTLLIYLLGAVRAEGYLVHYRAQPREPAQAPSRVAWTDELAPVPDVLLVSGPMAWTRAGVHAR